MYVYLLRSKSHPNQRYIGTTNDLKKRVNDHSSGWSAHTKEFAPWQLVAAIYFADETKARAFERYLKHGSGHAFANRHFW